MAEAATTEESQEEAIDTTGAPDSISVLDKLFTVVGQPPKQEQKVEKATTQEVKAESFPQAVKLEQPNLSPKARENFAKLEEAKKAAEERAAKAQADYEASQARIKEYEEKLKTAPSPEEFTAKERQYQERIQQLDQTLQAVALEKHPLFIKKYEEPKRFAQKEMKDLALSSGVSEEEFERAIKLGHQEKLDEIRESLPRYSQEQWDAAFRKIVNLDLDRKYELENVPSSFQQIQQREQEMAMQERSQIASQQLQQNITLAHRLADEPFEKIEALKDNDELRNEVRSTLEAIAGGKGAEKWNAEQLMREFAASVVQRHILQTQHTVIEGVSKELSDTKAQLEELQNKLDERESFIQKRYGSLPKNEVNGSSKTENEDDTTPLWKRIRVVTR